MKNLNKHKGQHYFSLHRKNADSGLFNSKKVALRIVTNIKKYSARFDRRSTKQELHLIDL